MIFKKNTLKYNLILFVVLLFSCDNKVGYVNPKFDSKINVIRLDEVLYESYPNSIGLLNDSLLNSYGEIYAFYFQNILNEGSPYTINANEYLEMFLKHPHVRQIENDIHTSFSSFSSFQNDIDLGLSYYNTLFKLNYQPLVVTINSAGNYEMILNDSIIYIGLDMYVGPDKKSIIDNATYPDYLKRKMDNKFLISDFFYSIISDKFYKDNNSNTFLSKIISFGKMMAILNRVLPDTKPNLLFKYSENEYKWAEENEYYIWEYVVKNKLLFTNSSSVINGWVNEAPFTNSLGSDSPSRLGVYLGWRIVEGYMKENNINIEALLNTENEKSILASYKPKK